MDSPYENLVQGLKSLPGLGYRSAEKIALHLLVEKPEKAETLSTLITEAGNLLGPCETCGNLSEEKTCSICDSEDRDKNVICVVESVTDLYSMERSGVFKGKYHVLQGKLSPIRGIGPEQLNFSKLSDRLDSPELKEIILALGNDMEGEATCHYLKEEIIGEREIQVSRIGFGLPSGAGITYADESTLKNALEGRKDLGLD
ncbi:MAG: recombination mediator RecR [Verrucomicrobiota bacterium]|nr:recombination mediator RecR [Verrucomicrobiota bacterium]